MVGVGVLAVSVAAANPPGAAAPACEAWVRSPSRPDATQVFIAHLAPPEATQGAALNAARHEARLLAERSLNAGICRGLAARSIECAAARGQIGVPFAEADARARGLPPRYGACAVATLPARWPDEIVAAIGEIPRSSDGLTRSLATALDARHLPRRVRFDGAFWLRSGCRSTLEGDALHVEFLNAAARLPSQLQIGGETDFASAAFRLLLATTDRLHVSGQLVLPDEGGTQVPIEGFAVSPLVFQTAGERDEDCTRPIPAGRSAARPRVHFEAPSQPVCHGGSWDPWMGLDRDAAVQVWSVAHDGRALHVWPPDGFGFRRLPAGRSMIDGPGHPWWAIHDPSIGQESLVTVALRASDAPAPRAISGPGFCRLPGSFEDYLHSQSWQVRAAVEFVPLVVLPTTDPRCVEPGPAPGSRQPLDSAIPTFESFPICPVL